MFEEEIIKYLKYAKNRRFNFDSIKIDGLLDNVFKATITKNEEANFEKDLSIIGTCSRNYIHEENAFLTTNNAVKIINILINIEYIYSALP